MCQLLIVDDETSVVDSLALTIPWNEYGIEEVHKAYSAQEALQISEKQAIDIMITDIQMPEMNGFQLNEKIKTSSPNIKTIILTGYDDFKYAQKAIRQQTVDYLLKPVDIKLLIKTVQNIVQNIETELKETSSYQHIKNTLHVNMPMLKSQLLNDLLKNDVVDLNHLRKRLAVFDSFKLDDLFMMIVIRLDEGFESYDLKSMSLIEFAVSNISEEIFQELFELWNCITDHGYIVFLVKSDHRGDLKLVNSYAEKLQKYIQTFMQGSITVCLSNIGVFPYDVRNIYQTSIETIKYNVGKNKSNFIIAKGISKELKNGNTINLHEVPTINSLLEAGDWDGAIARISHVLAITDETSEPSHDYLFRILLYLASSFSIFCKGDDRTTEEQLGEEFELLIQKRSLITKNRVFNWAEKWINSIRNKHTNYIDDSQERIIAKVRAFIHENLSEDMSLQTIAEKVNLHPVYLSKVYKNITNETIGEYIYQLRMKRADFLLRNTNLKIADVGNELGFFSQSHFIKVFKKRYGCTPQKYRDQNK
ncbi:response regulator [Litchfieldia salsa]|uniref:Two-component system, response regulator YesN n=1 Tax=Litchfieldia salsa TaxID=930152 RepID=A0A1H0VM74_9BACI|nr:response regulator [Litchfieldia salsa]SDP79381.1 two-component system, response regulator YesN [Litchfieldia salsa]